MKRIDINISINVPDWVYYLAVFVILKYRRLRYGYPFRRIRLTRGQFTMVDPEDFNWLSRYKWHASNGRAQKFYAVNSRMQRMHRMIMKVPKDLFVDHINGNGLDNRRANLRLATIAQNAWNSRHGFNQGKSKYKGVRWHKHQRKWVAVISVNGRHEYLGYFRDEREAAKAFDAKAKELRGEFAVLNFPK